MLSVEQVEGIIREKVAPLPPRAMSLTSLGQGLGGVLAQDVRMDEDNPRFDRATLDGYAVRSQDAIAGAELELVGQMDAGGAVFSGIVRAGTCVGINTGACVPSGADAILMVEHTECVQRGERRFVVVKSPVMPGLGIQPRGADARAGEVVLRSGARLGPAQLAVCAAAGVVRPQVRRARVAVLCTGDELVDCATPPPLPAGKIRNSNQVMLGALAMEAGAEVRDGGTSTDEAAPLRQALERGLAAADLLVVCGGLSMGTRDLVPPLLKDMGVVLHVEKVRIKPGKPFVLGTQETAAGRKYVAGLPGNPVSAFVTFHRFVRPMLRQMEGASDGPRRGRAHTDRALPANGEREFYQPCVLHADAQSMRAQVLAWKGSADIFTLARANGMLVQAAEAPAVEAGAEVEVFMW